MSERTRHLMMASLDGEISAEEQRELDAALAQDAELEKEWGKMKRLKQLTSTMTFREPPEEVWGEYWTSVYNRMERGIAWLLVSIGSVVILSYAAWQWIESILDAQELPLYLKLAIFGVAAGLIILAVSVVREKLFTHRHDPYKEVER